MMTTTDLFTLSPYIVLTATICVLLVTIAFHRNLVASCAISVTGLVLTFAAVLLVGGVIPRAVTPLLLIDGYALMFSGLVILASLATSLLAYDYFKGRETLQDEFFVLMLSAALGGMTLVAASHFASFMLGLELLGVSLYAMISYPPRGLISVEAALKYLIMSGVSSAFILFGVALMFAIVGGLGFGDLASFDYQISGNDRLILMAAAALIMAGVMFKLSLVPFHMWTPDVYEGAPAPVTAFLATVSKGAIFAVLLRLFTWSDLYVYDPVLVGLSIVAILSMLIGNLLALLQNNVKRVLAYSSIAHLGYLMVAFIAGGMAGGRALAVEAASYFLIAYFVTTLGAFAVITVMSAGHHDHDRDQLANYEGLFWTRPVLATVFSAMLLSLAGIPLTAGFIGKFYIFAAGAQTQLWMLLAFVVIGSGIGLFYYLRIIFNMTRRVDREHERISVPVAGGWVMVSLTVILVILGVYPSPVVELVNAMISSGGSL